MSDLDDLARRVKRAFGASSPAEVAARYKAIVGPTRSEDALVQGALEALRNAQKPTPLQLAALEQAIRVFRPAVFSVRRKLALKPENRPAFPEWDAFSAAVAPHLYAVGRIDRDPRAPGARSETDTDSIGTGFLVASTVLVTNRHVVEALSLGAMEIERGMGVVRFQEEKDVLNDERPVAIVGLRAIHPTLDLALLEIDPPPAVEGRAPFQIETAAPEVGRAVVIVGYPFDDGERNPMFVSSLFEGSFGLKRAAPGEVIKLGAEVVHHDCTTLGGNSGSPLLEMGTARVIGVQSRGGFLVRNTAVAGGGLSAFAGPFL